MRLELFSVLLLVATSIQGIAADGEKLYESAKCGKCHSLNGVGNKKMPLDSFLAVALSKADPIVSLKGALKSHGPKPAKVKIPTPLLDDDIASLVAFFRTIVPDYGAPPTNQDLAVIREQLVRCRTVGPPMEPFCPLDGYCGWFLTGDCPAGVQGRYLKTEDFAVTKYQFIYELQPVFTRRGKYISSTWKLGSDNVFRHDKSGTTMQVRVAIDKAFKGWRRDLIYQHSYGIGYFLCVALDKVGFSENKTSSELLLTVQLLRIDCGTFGNKLPSTAVVNATLKRASDSTIIFDKQFEGKGASSLGWTRNLKADYRAIHSFNVALGDVAVHVADEVLRAVTVR